MLRFTGSAVRALQRGTDLALELLGGEQERLVAPAHSHRERAGRARANATDRGVGDTLGVAFAARGRPTRSRSRTRAPAASRPRPRPARPARRSRHRAAAPGRARPRRASAALRFRRSASRNCRRLRPLSDASPTFASTQHRARPRSRDRVAPSLSDRRVAGFDSFDNELYQLAGRAPCEIRSPVQGQTPTVTRLMRLSLDTSATSTRLFEPPATARRRRAPVHPRPARRPAGRRHLPRQGAHAAQEAQRRRLPAAHACRRHRARFRRSAGTAPATARRRRARRRRARPRPLRGLRARFGAQLTVSWSPPPRRGEYDLADLLDAPAMDADQMEADFASLIATVRNPHLRRLLDALFGERRRGLAALSRRAGSQVLPPGLSRTGCWSTRCSWRRRVSAISGFVPRRRPRPRGHRRADPRHRQDRGIRARPGRHRPHRRRQAAGGDTARLLPGAPQIERIDGFPWPLARALLHIVLVAPRRARERQPGAPCHARGDDRARDRQPRRQARLLRPAREGPAGRRAAGRRSTARWRRPPTSPAPAARRRSSSSPPPSSTSARAARSAPLS